MRIRAAQILPNRGGKRRKQALTLVEMMITMSLFGVSCIALIYAQMFGMKADQLIQSKCGASDSSRRGFDLLATDIRSCKLWNIGDYSSGTFSARANGDAQSGVALKLCLSTNENVYWLYYFDTSRGKLMRQRVSNSVVSQVTTIASYLTNRMYFTAEDHRGDVKTDRSHKSVINTFMEFYQYQYPLTRVGTNYYYDYYKMQFKFTPHVPDGQ